MSQQETPLSILHLEDNVADALLIAYQIKADLPDCRIEHVVTAAPFLAALKRGGVDLILSDYRMPGYDGDEALKAAKAILPDVPFIMVTGELGEDRAIETVKRGATDYVLKDNLKRLVPSIRRALEEAAVLRQRKEAEAELHRTVEELRRATQELQRQAEELWVQQERLKFHVENSPLAVVEWSADFIVTRWSREAERLFGWKAADTIGKRIDALNMVYSEDVANVERTMQRLTSGAERTVVSTNRNCTSDGRVIECTWYNSVLLDEHGKMASVMSLVLDLTEQRRVEETLRLSEERLSIAFKGSVAGISISRPRDGLLIDVNDRWLELFGVQREEVVGKVVTLQLWKDIDQRTKLVHELERQGNVRDREVCFRRMTGEEWIGLITVGVTTLRGEKVLVSSVVDITDRKRAADELTAANEELMRFNRVAVDRELRMIDLKKEVNELCARLDLPPRYSLDFHDMGSPVAEPGSQASPSA